MIVTDENKTEVKVLTDHMCNTRSIVEFKLTEDNKHLFVIEGCDRYFSSNLNYEDVSTLIKELTDLQSKMVNNSEFKEKETPEKKFIKTNSLNKEELSEQEKREAYLFGLVLLIEIKSDLKYDETKQSKIEFIKSNVTEDSMKKIQKITNDFMPNLFIE